MDELGYQPRDTLTLWWLADPASPVPVGEISLVQTPERGVSLRYLSSWLQAGFALSEDLPLSAQEFFPTERDTAVGAVDDARPDRWGERVIRLIDRPPRLTLIDYLYLAGDDRFGALGVSTSAQSYEPRPRSLLPRIEDADALQELVFKVLANEPVPPEQRRLISPGGTMGGARPKALMEIDDEQWIVKLGAGDPVDLPLVEHASMTLATRAGIRCAPTQPIRLAGGHAVAIERFDRTSGHRRHCLSAKVALTAAGEEFGYPELAQLLRRRGVGSDATNETEMAELFRRMVFNILFDNTDDHEKNHVLVMTDANEYHLSPAFDLLPSGQALGLQQMRVGEHGLDSTLENALSECRLFSLSRDQAAQEIRRVIEVVEHWRGHFADCGVAANDIDLLSEQVDRPFLREQRNGF